VYLYSALFVVPHTQSAQAWITQYYLRLPRLRWRTSNCSLLLICLPRKDERLELAWLANVQRTVYLHKWSPVCCRSSRRQGKFLKVLMPFTQLSKSVHACQNNSLPNLARFCRAMVWMSAVFTVMRCPSVCLSVCLSVCHVRELCQNE